MQLKHYITKLIVLTVLTVLVGDLSYTARQAEHNESTSFIIEASKESKETNAYANLFHELPSVVVEHFGIVPSLFLAANSTQPAQQSDLRCPPVPLFKALCIFRI